MENRDGTVMIVKDRSIGEDPTENKPKRKSGLKDGSPKVIRSDRYRLRAERILPRSGGSSTTGYHLLQILKQTHWRV